VTRAAIVVAAFVVATSTVLFAQPADVPALIKLIENQPADMDRSVWKEKRRDAARQLAKTKDKRAEPVLEKLADSETFDVIGEIAIEGLGTLGDPTAIPALQKIAGDASRDQNQRNLAKKSLTKLGASADVPVTGGGSGSSTGTGLETPTGGGGGSATTGGGGSGAETGGGVETHGGTGGTHEGGSSGGGGLLGSSHADEPVTLPEIADDTLASSERMTFAAGTANFGYDTLQKIVRFDADIAGTYARRVEREKLAWGLDGGAHVVTGMVNPAGREQQRGALVDAHLGGEARFYAGSAYGVGKLVTSMQETYVSDVGQNPGNDFRNAQFIADAQIALGGGYGRVLDVGAAVRVRRLQRTLDNARALGRPIDASTSKKLQLTWWAMRGERSTYRALVATIAILREAGILLGEPDGGLTYEILAVLRDSQLYLRPSGLDIQLTVSEGYLKRPTDNAGNCLTALTVCGRMEQIVAQAGYGAQLQDDKLELSGSAYARTRVLADMGQPSPWALGAIARGRRFTYGDHGDPFGAFDLQGEIGVSSDNLMNADKSMRIAGTLGFTYWLNQASGIRLAAQVAEDGGALFIGGQLQGTYGLLDGVFAR
jgi:hypothetical protein